MNRSKRFGQLTLAFSSLEHAQLIEPYILLLLPLDVLPDRLLVSTNRGYVIPSCPKILTDKISLPSHEIPGYRNRTLPLDEPHHLRH